MHLNSIIPRKHHILKNLYHLPTLICVDLENYELQNNNLLIKEIINIAKCEIAKIMFLQKMISLDEFYRIIDEYSNSLQQKYCYYNGSELIARLLYDSKVYFFQSIYTFFKAYDNRIPLMFQYINESKLFCLDSNNRSVDDRLLKYNNSFDVMNYEELIKIILEKKNYFYKNSNFDDELTLCYPSRNSLYYIVDEKTWKEIDEI